LTQWLGNGSVGDDTFNKFYSSIVPGLVSNVEASEKMKHAGSALIDKVGVRMFVRLTNKKLFKCKKKNLRLNSLLSFLPILKLDSSAGS